MRLRRLIAWLSDGMDGDLRRCEVCGRREDFPHAPRCKASKQIIIKQSPDGEDGQIKISIASPTGDKLSISLTHEQATHVAWHLADLVEATP